MNVEIKITLGNRQVAGLLTLLGREAASLDTAQNQQATVVTRARVARDQQTTDQRDAFEEAMGYSVTPEPPTNDPAAAGVPSPFTAFGMTPDAVVGLRAPAPGSRLEDAIGRGNEMVRMLGLIPMTPEQRQQIQALGRSFSESNIVLSGILNMMGSEGVGGPSYGASPLARPMPSPSGPLPQVDLTPEPPPSSMPIPPSVQQPAL